MRAGVVGGNQVRLLRSGTEYFPALIEAIEQARHEVLLETYIFAHDPTGMAVAAALSRAARRGICVRIVVDGFGGRGFVRDTMPDLVADGVEVQIFRRELHPFSFRRHRLRRLHRKLSVIDGQIAFVGGINVIDDMEAPGQIPPRFDYAVRIEGPIVAKIQSAMIHLWRLVRWRGLRLRHVSQHWAKPSLAPRGKVVAAFLVRDNFRHRADIQNAYLDMLGAAREEVIIANAYFLPGRRFRHALVAAAERGVKVTLLLQGRVEYWLLHYATRALYPHLLGSRIRIFEYTKGFLHAKVAVADGWWLTVGSSNIDLFSLMLAREANVVIHDPRLAAELRVSLQEAIQNGATELHEADWRRRSIPGRLASWFALWLVGVMTSLAGYGRPH